MASVRQPRRSLIDVLNDPEGRRLVEAIEDVSASLNNRGAEGDAELSRIRASLVAELQAHFGFAWT